MSKSLLKRKVYRQRGHVGKVRRSEVKRTGKVGVGGFELRIYLDMCCYNRPYDDQSQLKVAMETQSKLHIQSLIKDKKLELIVSYMLRYECSKNPFEMRRNTIFEFMRENAFGYVGDERKEMVEAKAFEIMKTGIKFKDACHVASAIYSRCEYFISTDVRLLKYCTEEIKMVTPIEFITEMEGDE